MTPRLRAAIVSVSANAIMLPVQRQNPHGARMSPDTVVAIPVPIYDELIEAFDRDLEGEEPRDS